MAHPMLDQISFKLAVPDSPLYLRPVRLSDAPNMRDRCADPLNVQFLPHLQGKEIQTVSDVEDWIRIVQAGFNKDSLFLVVISTEGGTEKAIGEGPLSYINWDTQQAESGIMLDHQQAGKGIATKVLNTTMDFAFQQLGLQTVNYGTLKDNKAMAKVLQDKLKVKGTPQEKTRKDGKLELIFSFNRDEWLVATTPTD